MPLNFPDTPTDGTPFQGWVWNAATGAWLPAASAASTGNKNAFRNGIFDIWQRGTSVVITAVGTFLHTADGWTVDYLGAIGTVSRVANSRSGAKSLYAMQIAGNTGCTQVLIRQRIESYMAAQLAGRNVTVQFQITNNTGGSITPFVAAWRANTQDNFGGVTNELSSVAMQACPNGATTQVAYTFALSAAAITGVEIYVDFGNNFSTTGKSVIVAEADIQATPSATVGINASPPLSDLRVQPVELQLCMRYLQPIAVGNGGASSVVLPVFAAKPAPSFLDASISFPVVMRATPTLVGPQPTFTNADPTSGNNLAFFDNAFGNFLTFTPGTFSTLLIAAATTGTKYRMAAGAGTFNGAIGDSGNFFIGPTVLQLASAEL
jgi:hypothetical protein